MKKEDIYSQLDIGEKHFTDCFLVEKESTTKNDIEFINTVCKNENLHPNDSWNKIDFDFAEMLLLDAFYCHLRDTESHEMYQEKALSCKDFILSKFNPSTTTCYTNVSDNPWKSSSYSFNPVSNYDSDVAIVIVDDEKIIFTYFIRD